MSNTNVLKPLYKFADSIANLFVRQKPNTKKRKYNPKKHFTKDDNLLISYIHGQLDNNFTPLAIETHLVSHNYEKGKVHNLIWFVVSTRNKKELIDSNYSKITLFVFGALVILFYVLALALDLSVQLLFLSFSPIIFSSIFSLAVFSSPNIKNKELVWGIPFIFLFIFYFFTIASNQMQHLDLMPILVMNLIISLICIGVFEFLFKTKNNALNKFSDNDKVFLSLQKSRRK